MARAMTPQLREIARQLVEYEAGDGRDPAALAAAAARANLKLRQHLSKLIGPAGFHALVTRALVLAKKEHTLLGDVRVEASGEIIGLEAIVQRPDWPEGETGPLSAVFATFLWLLVTFIGADLALRLVQDQWPDVPLPNPDFGLEEAVP